MKTIYKYLVQKRTELPVGAKILTVHCQNFDIFLWAEVDTDSKLETRHFQIVGTGWNMEFSIGVPEYLGTAFMENGLVWHIYETK